MAFTKESGIYCIEHRASGKRYVGSAANLDRRFKKHIKQLENGTHHSPKLQAAWNKYGADAFDFIILLLCPVDQLLQREQEELDILDTVEFGYNISRFADAPMRGRSQSEETKAKMRESHKNRAPISEETRERLRESARLREKAKKEQGFEVSEETRQKLSVSGKGRIVSEETRQKISEKNKGQQLTEEQKRKQIEALTGRKLSEEHRRAISESGFRRWEAHRNSSV